MSTTQYYGTGRRKTSAARVFAKVQVQVLSLLTNRHNRSITSVVKLLA